MSATNVELREPAADGASLIQKHPRGRGFGILSRLARVDDVPGRHVREGAVRDDQTTVVAFERRHPARHRSDDATRGMLHFG